jgi:hypothetical protein
MLDLTPGSVVRLLPESAERIAAEFVIAREIEREDMPATIRQRGRWQIREHARGVHRCWNVSLSAVDLPA